MARNRKDFRLTPEQRQERDAQLQRTLSDASKQLLTELEGGKSEKLLEYLRFSAKLHNYSPQNQWLIYAQMPLATRVASFTTWNRLGFRIKAGEHGAYILRPVEFQRRKRIEREDGEDEQIVTGGGIRFTPEKVFDVSQLAPSDKPIPEFFAKLPDDQGALYDRLAAVVRGMGIVLEEGPTHGAEGVSMGGCIRLKPGMDSTRRVLTLTHELAHELLHQGNGEQRGRDKAAKEWQAEGVSYVVAAALGIENPRASDYLLNYNATPETFLQELATVQATAKRILAALHGEQQGEQE